MGIPREDVPHIFERFYRGTQVASQHIPGTGLGLAIVKQIVEAHAGTVEVESVPGEGTTFTVRLPRGLVGTQGNSGELRGTHRDS
jgi:signal transduction histidine kinase